MVPLEVLGRNRRGAFERSLFPSAHLEGSCLQGGWGWRVATVFGIDGVGEGSVGSKIVAPGRVAVGATAVHVSDGLRKLDP